VTLLAKARLEHGLLGNDCMNCSPTLGLRGCAHGWAIEIRCSKCGKSAGEFFYTYPDQFDETARAAVRAWDAQHLPLGFVLISCANLLTYRVFCVATSHTAT
jgi:DNA-directed RNA polymerase subunit N (RpoN/RPB10)